MKNTLFKLFPLALLLAVALGCNMAKQVQKGISEATEPKVLTSTDNSCQITVPALWQTATDLNADATLQASNLTGEMYVMVIRDDRSDFKSDMKLDGYADLLRKSMPTRMPDAQTTAPTSTTVNGLDAVEFEMTGSVQNIKFNYIYDLVATKDSFYQVISWTLPSKYDSNKTDMLSVMHTFKTLDAGKSSATNSAKGPGNKK